MLSKMSDSVFRHKAMEKEDFFDSIYYRLLKRYLIYIGQYPYQTKKLRMLCFSMHIFFLTSVTIPEVYELSHNIVKFDVDQIITCLPIIFADAVCFVKLINMHIHNKEFRNLFDRIKEHWNLAVDENERRILQQFAGEGNNFCLMYRNGLFAIVCVFLVFPLYPIFLDIILPLNQSRERNRIVETDYLVDDDKYFYEIYVHSSWCSLCGVLIIVTTDMSYMILTQHGRALFFLSGYRVKHLTEYAQGITEGWTPIEQQILQRKLKYCVITHQNALEFAEVMSSCSSTSYLLQVGISIISISITGLQTIIKLHQMEEASRFALFVLAQTVHLFFHSMLGQRLVESSSELGDVIYSSEWHIMPTKLRRVLLQMQMKTRKPCKLTAGGFYDMNIENFGVLVKTSMTYLTVFLSFRE